MENEKLYQLIQAIRLVALDCADQIQSFPEFVVVPDEIAITLNDTILTFESSGETASLAPGILDRIKQLDGYFDAFGKNEFSLEALCRSARWAHSRELAREILELMGLSGDKPDLGWIRFIGGSL